MDNLLLFTDGSVHAQLKIGIGAYLILSEHELSMNSFSANVKLRRFDETSSTKLELQTLLWALGEIQKPGVKVIVYTDSQNIIGLKQRRQRLEKNNYRTKKNKLINNSALYKEFFKLTDQLDYELVKVKGHSVASEKDYIDQAFSQVDKASRNALRAIDEIRSI